MKILRVRIADEARSKKVDQYVIERDYALGYILAGIAANKKLQSSLIFKGGTALKKMFFGEYRFSEDLDFSTIDAPKQNELEAELQNVVETSNKLLNEFGPFEVSMERRPEREPHPNGQEAFSIFVKYPWQREDTPCCVKVEITHDEPVILPPEERTVLHGYDENLNASIFCYSIEEIIAEKLRALLQTHQKIITRGWSGPRARDYYDLWRILKEYHNHLNKKKLLTTLNEKCEYRSVSYTTIEDFFTPELNKAAHQSWEGALGRLIPDLPPCEYLLDETKSLILKTIF